MRSTVLLLSALVRWCNYAILNSLKYELERNHIYSHHIFFLYRCNTFRCSAWWLFRLFTKSNWLFLCYKQKSIQLQSHSLKMTNTFQLPWAITSSLNMPFSVMNMKGKYLAFEFCPFYVTGWLYFTGQNNDGVTNNLTYIKDHWWLSFLDYFIIMINVTFIRGIQKMFREGRNYLHFTEIAFCWCRWHEPDRWNKLMASQNENDYKTPQKI